VITRNITRRLDRLEEETMPVGEPTVIQVVFESTDGTEMNGPRVKIPACPASRSQRR
jgi:hypothetical protein